MEPAIIVQGGSAAIPEHWFKIIAEGIKKSVLEGNKVLIGGGSAMDAVVAAVTVMEDDEAFNAGKGSSWTTDQTIEMDAAVMDGKNLSCGAVTCVRDIANPVQLARAVMEKTRHCCLAGQGANEFAEHIGVPKVNPDDLKSDMAQWKWDQYQRTAKERGDHGEIKPPKTVNAASKFDCDTVGAVALDCHGNLAVAVSTGGMMATMPGRVGDSPVVGGGLYADNESCAVTSTGQGETILKMCLARRVAEAVERGDTVQQAVDSALQAMNKKLGDTAGLIAISKTGEIVHAYTTHHLSWASVQKGVLSYGTYQDTTQEKLDEVNLIHEADEDKNSAGKSDEIDK